MSVTADTVIDTIRKKIVDRTYLGHMNTHKIAFFDSIKDTLNHELSMFSSQMNNIIEKKINTTPCIIELIVVLLRNSKNYRTLNTSSNSAARRSRIVNLIIDILMGIKNVLKEELITITKKIYNDVKDGDYRKPDQRLIDETYLGDLYTLYYGDCKIGGPDETYEVDLQLQKLIQLTPEHTNFGKLIRDVPSHKTCMGDVCSLFTGKKRIQRNANYARIRYELENEQLSAERPSLISSERLLYPDWEGGSRKTRHRKNVTRKSRRRQSRTPR